MTSYNHLSEKLMDDYNIELAIYEAALFKRKKNKRHKKLRYIKAHAKPYVPIAKKWLETFDPPEHTPIELRDKGSGKIRHIVVPTYQEEICHHAVTRVLKPIFKKGMYEHSYASIPGVGVHSAMKRLKKWIYNDHANTKYCLKLDIKKFFDSVDQDVLLGKLCKIIRDDSFYDIVEKIVRSVPAGLPLGFTTSQWFANFLLTELDHKIKEEWGAKYYMRFMDDMVILGSNKRKLHELKDKIETYLKDVLHLELKSNWQLFLVDNIRTKKKGRFIDFLGFKFYRNHVGIRRRNALAIQRTAKRISKKPRATIHDARRIVTYAGLCRYADCHNWFKKHVSRYVSIRYMRKKISKYQRRMYGNQFSKK